VWTASFLMNSIRGFEKSVLLTDLGAAHPKWQPLLAVIEDALREMERPVWAEHVPAMEASRVDGEAPFSRFPGD